MDLHRLLFACVVMLCAAGMSQKAVESQAFGYASWNIGHFALGRQSSSTIKPEEADGKLKEYLAFLEKSGAEIVGLCEWNDRFSGESTASALLFPGWSSFVRGTQRGAQYNAIASRKVPLEPGKIVEYARRSQRTYYLVTEAMIDGHRVVFVQTHLDWDHFTVGHEDDRADQIQTLIRTFKDEPYVVISGDFNTCLLIEGKWIDNAAEFKPFVEAGFTQAIPSDVYTWPAKKPIICIDNIFVKGFAVRDARVMSDASLSDHVLVCCTLVPLWGK